MTPDHHQKAIIRHEGDQLVLMHRQKGKSTTEAARLLPRMMFRPGYFALIFSKTQRQASELFKKLRFFYRPYEDAFPADISTALHLWLKNGSRVLSLGSNPDNTVGYSAVDEAVFDEAALIRSELFNAVTPMLGKKSGCFTALTTAKQQRGWFWELFTNGGEVQDASEAPARLNGSDDYCRRFVSITESLAAGSVSQKFIDKELRRMGQKRFSEDYLCQFSGDIGPSGNQPFKRAEIDACMRNIEPGF